MAMTLEKSWYQVLLNELQKPYIKELKSFLDQEKKKGYIFYPPENLVFNALRKTPFKQVKVVIMGQDPYHGERQAHGLSFSVQRNIPIPPSLKNIYKELYDDLGISIASHGCLEKWANQGVLLLNATLTVRAKEPRSHYGKGWETFTDAIIEKLCLRKDPLVFLLWGKSAREKCETILNHLDHPHEVFVCAHPSPYSASQFFGCRHFSKTNNYLKKWGKDPIDWSLDESHLKGFST